ncbi:ATP-binding protein [Antarctobacter heliothermus]
MVLGLVFGISIIVLSINAYVLEAGALLTAVAGVLIFAGYMGGLPAALITLLVAVCIRIWIGGSLLSVGLIALFGYALCGLALRRLAPFEAWPKPPLRAFFYGLAAHLIVQTMIGAAVALSGTWVETDSILLDMLAFYMVGSLSVLLMWLAISQSVKLASIVQDNVRLLRRIRLVMDHNNMGAFSYVGSPKKLVVDQGLLDLFGLEGTPGPMDPQAFIDLLHPDDRDQVIDVIQNSPVVTELLHAHDFRIIRPDGTQVDVRSVRATEIDEATGKVRVVGLHTDLSDFRKAERQRNEAEHQIAVIAENIPGMIYQGIWEKGAPREFTYISKKCIDIWGFTQEELMADNSLLSKGQDEETVIFARNAVNKCIETGKPAGVRIPVRARDGTVRTVDMHARTTDLADGTHRVDAIFIDVSAEVAAEEKAVKQEEQAHRSQKLESIGKLTGGVAHDFNNILAVIMGNLELLREEIDDPTKRELIDAGLEASHRGAELTRSMLAFARRARLTPVLLDLNAVALQAKNWMRRALPESVQIETSLLAGLWTANVDAASLESALLNLILNARDAVGGHGKVTIETANVRIDQAYVDSRNEPLEPGRYVMLAVSDTGTGIDQETLDNIFEPFFTTKPPGSGSGLGLSMVLGFVKQSGGTVQVYTEPGQGTTFKLYFPASDETPMAKAASSRTFVARPVGKSRILLAEDEAAVRKC